MTQRWSYFEINIFAYKSAVIFMNRTTLKFKLRKDLLTFQKGLTEFLMNDVETWEESEVDMLLAWQQFHQSVYLTVLQEDKI